MRHKVKKPKLNLRKEHRDSMLRNLATSLVIYDKIQTTRLRAKATAQIVERMISTAKKKDKMNAVRELNSVFYDTNASRKVIEKLLERYADKNSGFTRITNISLREGDRAQLVQLELI